MRAGTVAAIASSEHELSQPWSRDFYEHPRSMGRSTGSPLPVSAQRRPLRRALRTRPWRSRAAGRPGRPAHRPGRAHRDPPDRSRARTARPAQVTGGACQTAVSSSPDDPSGRRVSRRGVRHRTKRRELRTASRRCLTPVRTAAGERCRTLH
jgi:hypothetical protein